MSWVSKSHLLLSLSTTPSRPCGFKRSVSILLCVWTAIRYPHHQPVAQKLAKDSAQNDGNEYIAVVVHDEQHDDIGETEGDAVDNGADQLLQAASTKGCELGAERRRHRAVAAIGRRGSGQGSLLCAQVALELAHQEGIVFVTDAAQELEADDEQGSADAAGGEHGVVFDVPGTREEARVDDVPVPEHLHELVGGLYMYQHCRD